MEHNQIQPQQEDVYGADIHGYNAQGVPIGAAQWPNGEGAANFMSQHPPRNARVIGTFDEHNIHGNKSGIRAPAVENKNFENKSNLIIPKQQVPLSCFGGSTRPLG